MMPTLRIATALALGLTAMLGCTDAVPGDSPTAVAVAANPCPPAFREERAIAATRDTPSLQPCAVFEYASSGGNLGATTATIQITSMSGENVHFRSYTKVGTAERIESSQSSVIQNGVFFPYAASPVKQDVSLYPEETITVPAGTFACRRIDTEKKTGATYWFAGQVLVRSSAGKLTTELADVR